jgi:hypothetical protein
MSSSTVPEVMELPSCLGVGDVPQSDEAVLLAGRAVPKVLELELLCNEGNYS